MKSKKDKYRVIILDDDKKYLESLCQIVNISEHDFEFIPFFEICDFIEKWERAQDQKNKDEWIKEKIGEFWDRLLKSLPRGKNFGDEYDAIAVDYYWSEEEEKAKEGSGIKIAEAIREIYKEKTNKFLNVPVIVVSREKDPEIRSTYEGVFIVKRGEKELVEEIKYVIKNLRICYFMKTILRVFCQKMNNLNFLNL